MAVPGVLPPSPPTTSSRKHMYIRRSLSIATTTPDDSPASIAGSSGGLRKRVEFSPWTNVHDPPISTPTTAQPLAIKPLPPSRECQTLSKSILKPFNDSEVRGFGIDGQQDANLSSDETMDSIVQQLSADDRATRIEAYATLVSLLKAYEDVPEMAVLKSKIAAVTRSIRKDLAASELTETDPSETNLVNQALKALVTLVWSQDFSPLLTDEFRAFVLDRSIQVLTERKVPKSNVVHYLHLLGTQSFRQNLVQANSRATKLLDALKVLTENYNGSGVVSERLLVYHRLLDQARPTMQAKAASWLRELLMGLVSPSKDTRSKAITLGMKACTVFPSSIPVSNSLRELFKTTMDDGRDTSSHMCRRLEKMTIDKDDSAQVPQSWAVVVILMGGLRGRIESWNSLKDWLKVIQRCFNCSDSDTRYQANLAWNRFVAIVRPHEASEPLVSMLVKPITAQMERRPSDKQTKTSRATALSSYCNLLYYAFRPAANPRQYSRAWNEHVVKVMTSSFFQKNAENADLACRVLLTLFWDTGSKTKIWKEHRAHENNPIYPEELPTVDCKWIRAKASSIIQLFDVIARYSSWGPTGASDQAYVAQAWRHFAKALSEACSREIKASSETKQAVESVSRYLCLLEKESHGMASDGSKAQEQLSSRLRFLTRAMVSQIGVMPIVEVIEADTSLSSAVITDEIARSVLTRLSNIEQSASGRSLTNPHTAYRKLLALLDEDLIGIYGGSEARLSRFFPHPLETALLFVKSTPEPFLGMCLEKLQRSLCLWLEDADRINSYGAFQNLMLSVVKALSRTNAEDLSKLDALFTAGFTSTRKENINQMIEMWDTNFAHENGTALPPFLNAALERLKPFTGFGVSGSHFPQELTVIPLFPPSQAESQESTRFPASRDGHVPENGSHASPELPHAARHEGAESYQGEPAEGSTSHVAISTPKRKVRHDDSQVQFVAIESSPMTTGDFESQYLTNKQKEVRDRQRAKTEIAAFFSDLGSRAPAANDRTGPLTGLIVRRAASEECPATPTLPVAGEIEQVVASPTPRSKQQVLRIDDIDNASSPLAVACDAASRDIPSSPLKASVSSDDDVMIDVDLEPIIALNADPGLEQITDSTAVTGPTDDVRDSHGENAGVLLTTSEEHQTCAEKEVEHGLQVSPRNDAGSKSLVLQKIENGDTIESETYRKQLVKDRALEEENGERVVEEIVVEEHVQIVTEVWNFEEEEIPELDLVEKGIFQDQAVQEEDREESPHQQTEDENNAPDLTADIMEIENLVSGANSSTRIAQHDAKIPGRSPSAPVDCMEVNSPETVHSYHNLEDDSQLGPKTDSDDIDMMSASQLSNDLDWHVEREVKTSETPVSPPKRKRSQKLVQETRKRQRTSALPSSGTSDVYFETAVQQTDGEELYDCIVVDTSRRLAPVPSSKRKRGRPSQAASRTSSRDLEEATTGASPDFKLDIDSPLPSEMAPQLAEPQAAVIGEDESIVHQPEQNSVEAEEDILASLRDVLDRLKRARAGQVDLRAVDDLCFDIRTEAQNAAKRNAAS